MRNTSGYDYRNSSFIVDEAMGQIPRSTERISDLLYIAVILELIFLLTKQVSFQPPLKRVQ